jgi:hypothetical protein
MIPQANMDPRSEENRNFRNGSMQCCIYSVPSP